MDSLFHQFKSDISSLVLPEKLNFPFYYEATDLAKRASKELQDNLITKTDWNYDFGMYPESDPRAMGKMFGVLVVQNENQSIGYLAGFSGKIGDSNHFDGFVPPVFDMLEEDGYFRSEENELNQLTKELSELNSSSEYEELKLRYKSIQESSQQAISDLKKRNKKAKLERDEKRNAFKDLVEFDKINQELKSESKKQSLEIKIQSKKWREQIDFAKNELEAFENKIKEVKKLRADKSNALQNWLFHQYNFLNGKRESQDLLQIFEEFSGMIPPGGSGECAAPKLFQYAYQNKLKPITFAEFWWGKPPSSEIRKHKQFYPSCRSKCEPILNFMLQGVEVDENPMLVNPGIGKNIKIVYEDEVLAVIHKPAEFLSVPGKTIQDSVYTRVKELYPEATGPIIVHRLDMSTSGLMLIAKDKKTHEKLQKQFLEKSIQKRYVAILQGEIKMEKGEIKLPLRVDLDNRPQQMVCYEHGKNAHTKFEVIEKKNNQSKVYFYPITGRTHQLRVHAAHPNGLNTPIKGDDLYGNRADRLYLQAQQIEFYHPTKKERMLIEDEWEF